jgi:hypothetical protein
VEAGSRLSILSDNLQIDTAKPRGLDSYHPRYNERGRGVMPNSDLSPWKQSYEAALRNQDTERLTDRIFQAEAAIFQRQQELAGSSDHYEEKKEMEAASEDLLAIKTHKLGWPPVKGH